MSFTQPYQNHPYMGEHASDGDVLTFIRAQKWDTTADGNGNPRNGMQYYNTASHVLKLYADGSWVTISTT